MASAHPSQQFPVVAPTDPVQIQYTSGTTGFPKGALLHHKGIVNEATFVMERAGMGDGGVCINTMPLYHIGGGAVTELGTFAVHGTYVVLPGFDAALSLDAESVVHRHFVGCERACGSPPAGQVLVASGQGYRLLRERPVATASATKPGAAGRHPNSA